MLHTHHNPIFSDGLLLCSIVQRIEVTRGFLRGVHKTPTSKGHMLHNIRIAIRALKSGSRGAKVLYLSLGSSF